MIEWILEASEFILAHAITWGLYALFMYAVALVLGAV